MNKYVQQMFKLWFWIKTLRNNNAKESNIANSCIEE